MQCVISVFIGIPNYKNRLKFNTERVSSRPATRKIYFSNIAVCEAAAWCFLSGLQHFISLCWLELVLRVGFIFRKPKVSINYIALADLSILRTMVHCCTNQKVPLVTSLYCAVCPVVCLPSLSHENIKAQVSRNGGGCRAEIIAIT